MLVDLKDGLTHKVFYVAQFLKPEDSNKEVEVSFLRKSTKFEGVITFPAVSKVPMVKMTDIKTLLPPPMESGSTKHLK